MKLDLVLVCSVFASKCKFILDSLFFFGGFVLLVLKGGEKNANKVLLSPVTGNG